MKSPIQFLFSFIICISFSSSVFAEGAGDLSKASQNPVGDIISLPFENNSNFNTGPNDTYLNVLTVKPVYPVNFGKWNLINRGIMPIIYQEERFPGEGNKFGTGDLNYQGFISPAKPGKIIWGIGPAIVLPTHSDNRLGGDKWSMGPAAVALATPGNWVVGVLTQQVWDVAGPSDAADVSSFLLQPFVNYNMKDGWFLTSSPVMTANWEATSGNRFTIPLGGGFGRVFNIGKQPINAFVQAFGYADKPAGGPDWTLRAQWNFLFPIN